MIGQYKLAKVHQGIGYFACVKVFTEKSSTISQVFDSIEEIDESQCEISSKTHPHWVYLAILGAEEALEELKKHTSVQNYIVKIIKLIGTEVDTTDDAVKVASAMATWRGIYPDGPHAEIKFDRQWEVQYPIL